MMNGEVKSRMVVSITKEELGKLPMVHYIDGAEVVDTLEAVAAAVAHLRAARIIGFDTETRPSFRKGVSHVVSLMQLASPERCYLFRLNVLGMPEALKALLEDSKVRKVGISLRDDFHSLSRICDLKPGGFVDLQEYVKRYRIADNSLARIYAILFGERISKGQRLTNWEAAQLTAAQINYAAFDAISCIRIYDYIAGGRFEPTASKYYRKEEVYEQRRN